MKWHLIKSSFEHKEDAGKFTSTFDVQVTGKNLVPFTSSHQLPARPATLLKKRLWHRCFPVNFAKFLRTPYFTEHLSSMF